MTKASYLHAFKGLRALACAAVLCGPCFAVSAAADPYGDLLTVGGETDRPETHEEADFRFLKDYPLGVKRFQVDHATRVTGWKVTETLYIGKQGGDGDGLALVWQGENNQVSVSPDGLRLTRRF